MKGEEQKDFIVKKISNYIPSPGGQGNTHGISILLEFHFVANPDGTLNPSALFFP